tara:strand:- start:6022 stop:6186 length:165 start_codon:yes stop_codon:yes gene_type:complete
MVKSIPEEQAFRIAKRLQAWADRNKENSWVQRIAKAKIQELNIRLTYSGSVVIY